MLSALHGVEPPKAHLPEPECLQMTWCETARFSFRSGKKQSLSGWLVEVRWPDTTPESWKPWLQLSVALGVGRQSSFSLGCFEMLGDAAHG